jgi:hypothetical protein
MAAYHIADEQLEEMLDEVLLERGFEQLVSLFPLSSPSAAHAS